MCIRDSGCFGHYVSQIHIAYRLQVRAKGQHRLSPWPARQFAQLEVAKGARYIGNGILPANLQPLALNGGDGGVLLGRQLLDSFLLRQGAFDKALVASRGHVIGAVMERARIGDARGLAGLAGFRARGRFEIEQGERLSLIHI